jgi:hypothetical protein
VKYLVVDTDAFSHLWQSTGPSLALEPYLTGAIPVVSFATVGEVYFGATYAGWGSVNSGILRRLSVGMSSHHTTMTWPSFGATSRLKLALAVILWARTARQMTCGFAPPRSITMLRY